MANVILPNFTTIPCDYPWLYNSDLEKNFDHVAAIGWFQKYWTSAFIICAIYLVLIFAAQRFMKNRPRYELYWPLTLWSSSLAIYSWMCVFRAWGEFLYIVRNYGWHATVCNPTGYTSIAGFWVLTYMISKAVELGDTAFIILRKQKLIFLHWYHHMTVLLYSWYSYQQVIAPGRYFITVNCTVHALMYTYYAVKASKLFRIPIYVNIFITAFQTTQMFIAIVVNVYALGVINSGEDCSTNYNSILVSFMMFLSYFILFLHYFYQAYLAKKPSKISDTKAAVNGHGQVLDTTKIASNGHGHVANGKRSIKSDTKKEL